MKLADVLAQNADKRIKIWLVNGEAIDGESLTIGDELVEVRMGDHSVFVCLDHIASFEVF